MLAEARPIDIEECATTGLTDAGIYSWNRTATGDGAAVSEVIE